MRKDAPKVAIFRTQVVRKDQIILNDLSIEIDAGSWTEIIGQSGAGKSDLFSSLSLRKKPKIGQVVFGGMNLDKMDGKSISEARFSIGSCAQSPIFLEHKSIRENLALPLLVRGMNENEVNEEIVKITDAFAMTLNLNDKLSDLDSDDRVLVGIARAFVGSPKLVLLDGVLSVLSLRHQNCVLRHLRLQNLGGTTIVIFGRSLSVTSNQPNAKDAVFTLNRNGVSKGALGSGPSSTDTVRGDALISATPLRSVSAA